tara:strand:- start:290 stop:721 length:432 start_codon:yes stop_codon:yes gene_type:complete
MKFFYSIQEKDKLLHIVFKKEDFNTIKSNGRKDIINPDQFIQLSALKLFKNQTFKPHQHVWKKGEKKVIAQESWVVVKGRVKCSFFDLDCKLISNQILNSGDCSITLEGGHTYTILEEGTLVYEFKTGPYKGQKNDKEFLDEI